jgi:hypothetical protein
MGASWHVNFTYMGFQRDFNLCFFPFSNCQNQGFFEGGAKNIAQNGTTPIFTQKYPIFDGNASVL